MKEQKKSELRQNEKVLAIYRAVIDLIEEDAEIPGIKVADITNRAGIGKGTAYEYFSSKEEIIACALFYDMEQQLLEIQKLIKQQGSMKDKIYGIFQWLEKSFGKRSSMQFYKVSCNAFDIQNSVHDEFQKTQGKTLLQEILNYLIQEGKAQGWIHPEIPVTLASMSITSGLISFFMYLEHEKEIADTDREKVKSFLYSNMEQNLQLLGSTAANIIE